MSNKVQNVLLGVLAVGLIGITVAYAALTQQLKIEGTAKVEASTWDIHFETLEGAPNGYATLATDAGKLAIQSDTTIISGNLGTLKAPGDSITYTFDIVNAGDINAKLGSINIGTPTCTATDSAVAAKVCGNLTYTLTYENGDTIQVGDTLNKKTTKKAKLVITSKNTDVVASEDVSVDGIDATFLYNQAN